MVNRMERCVHASDCLGGGSRRGSMSFPAPREDPPAVLLSLETAMLLSVVGHLYYDAVAVLSKEKVRDGFGSEDLCVEEATNGSAVAIQMLSA